MVKKPPPPNWLPSVTPFDPAGQGKRIAAARKAMGFTQARLAKAIHVSKGAVSQYEQGVVTDIGSYALQRMAEVLDVSVRYLLCGIPPITRPVYVTPEEKDLLETFRELPKNAQDQLRAKAHEYHDLFGPPTPTRAHPLKKSPAK